MSEAEARTGVDCRTAHRWREQDARFDRDCRNRLEWHREEILFAAGHRVRNPKVRPVLYRRRQIGHIARPNDTLMLAYVKAATPRDTESSFENVPLRETRR